MKPVLTHLRQQGYISNLYLDDFLLLGHTHQGCIKNINATISLLTKLGFTINYKKSNLFPSHIVTYLGFVYNSQDMSVSLPQDKVAKLLALVTKFMNIQSCKIREFAKFTGSLISACPAVRYGFLYTKLFERYKFLALSSSGNYDTKMTISRGEE